MTGVRITVNDRELHQVLRRLARLGGEPGRFLRPIGLQLINSTRERARREVSPDFTPWPELTPAYAKTKRGAHMMRAAGNLLGSLTREVEGNTLRVGTNRIYAAIHQFGGEIERAARQQTIYRRVAKDGSFAQGGRFVKRSRSNFATTVNVGAGKTSMPARPWLGISRDDVTMIREEFEAFALRATRRG